MQDPPDIYQILEKFESKLPVCRVCLNLSMEYIELDSTLCVVDDTDISYFDAFQLVTPSQVELYDRLTKTLCSSCGKDLLNAFLFRKRVENADIILKKIISGETLCHIQSLHVNVENEDIEDKNSTAIEQNYLEVDIISQDHDVEVCNEFTDIDKSLDSWPKGSIYVDSEQESTINESIGLEESIRPNLWLCDDCGEEYNSRKSLQSHRRIHQTSHYDEMSFEPNNDLNNSHLNVTELESVDFKKFEIDGVDHINITKGKELYSCKNCNKKFHTKVLLKLHTFRCHKDHGSMRSMVRKSFLKVHKEAHFGPRNTMCAECGKQFGGLLALRTHSLIHKQSGEFLCHICNKVCLTKYALKSHIQFKHIADKSTIGRKKFKYQCEDCGLIFQYPSKLRVHQRMHNAEAPYICPHCNRTYLRKDQFNIHMRYHNNDFPYKCDLCDKSYATKNNLSEHRKSVHDNVTYSCDKCDQKFKSVTGLRKHKFVHTGYPYVCPICGLGQSFRSGIKAHLLRVHKDTFTEEEFNETFPVVIPKSGFRRPKS